MPRKRDSTVAEIACAGFIYQGCGHWSASVAGEYCPAHFYEKDRASRKSPLHDAAVNPKRPSDSGQTRNRAEFNVCSSGDCPSTDRSGKASSAYCGWLGGRLDRWLDRLLGDRSGVHRSRHSAGCRFDRAEQEFIAISDAVAWRLIDLLADCWERDRRIDGAGSCGTLSDRGGLLDGSRLTDRDRLSGCNGVSADRSGRYRRYGAECIRAVTESSLERLSELLEEVKSDATLGRELRAWVCVRRYDSLCTAVDRLCDTPFAG